APLGPPVRLQQSRLEVEGKPFFPRIVPYHGESLNDLAKMRLNTAWVPDYRDLDLLADLRRAGLWAMAVPPRATVDGERIDATSVPLAPFRRDTSPILFWYLGTRIPPEARNELFQWEDQIRNADQAMNRPVMADVGGLERSFSKRLSMLGVS